MTVHITVQGAAGEAVVMDDDEDEPADGPDPEPLALPDALPIALVDESLPTSKLPYPICRFRGKQAVSFLLAPSISCSIQKTHL